MMASVVVLSGRLIRSNLKMPIFVILSLTQPVLYLVFFGQLFSNIPSLASEGAETYVDFLAPGMAMLAAMFGSIYSGMGTLNDVERGMFDRIVASPAPRPSIPLSYLVATTALVLLQTALILIVAALMGATAKTGVAGTLAVMMIGGLVGVGFGAISNALAFLLPSPGAIMPLFNIIALPMMFLSNIMISWGLMPGWIHAAATFNPLSWAVTAARSAYLGGWDGRSTTFLLLLVLFCVAAIALMLASFRRFVGRR